MLGKTHMLGGAVGAAIYVLATASTTSTIATIAAEPASSNIETTLGITVTAIGTGILGGLIPDIDHPNSKISQKLKPVSKIINLIFSHRGLFHTPILYVIIWGLLTLQIVDPYWRFLINAMFAGIASHLILDSLNPTGIPLFFPVEHKRRNFANIKTGSWLETLVFGVLFVNFVMLCRIIKSI